ncbi:similar to Saccharomyces cerevisiae YMR112C MED11 Subunit of the RNA polymerase II mediator complex [Maudiozyma saulgeensis]|uniref:Mediator of RNA polymerase II transcription subunit 11 n=1 Tax=Maudiozyma saulgeensis TaxID=1789683 RepID=A0A1X7R0E8_9SACH|nr:similar to Saccharomyces cerevisiae YMR112C MED11 Subunit of the RNA polymerase II mediator complex [Kazachstania saulgeensis]
MQPEYVKERLAALDEIDMKLCGMLQEASQVVHAFSEVKSGNDAAKPQFTKHVEGFYTDLESATIRLRNEIKLLDDNIGTRLLPINVNKKALGQDDEKLHEQIGLLKATLSGNTYAKEQTPELPESSTGVEENNKEDHAKVNDTTEITQTESVQTQPLQTEDTQTEIIQTEVAPESTAEMTEPAMDVNEATEIEKDNNENNDDNDEDDDIEMEDV